MPIKLERKLKAQARKKGFGKKRTGAYVYGTMRKMGWKPSHQKKGGRRGNGDLGYRKLNCGL